MLGLQLIEITTSRFLAGWKSEDAVQTALGGCQIKELMLELNQYNLLEGLHYSEAIFPSSFELQLPWVTRSSTLFSLVCRRTELILHLWPQTNLRKVSVTSSHPLGLHIGDWDAKGKTTKLWLLPLPFTKWHKEPTAERCLRFSSWGGGTEKVETLRSWAWCCPCWWQDGHV